MEKIVKATMNFAFALLLAGDLLLPFTSSALPQWAIGASLVLLLICLPYQWAHHKDEIIENMKPNKLLYAFFAIVIVFLLIAIACGW